MSGYDHERVSRAVGAALAGPGGVGLVVKVFCDWRYEVTHDGRLSAAHLVNGIVLAEEVLAAGAVGPHIARALGQVVSSYGPTVMPNVNAALEVLEAAGPGF
jgi:hypothetical protein